jgi:hypothetical protein
MNQLVSIRGRIDLHIHAYPSLVPRIGDDRQVAQAAAEAGMKGIALKCHHESTVSRAYLLRHEFPQLEIYGGIVLNSYVGGMNPAAAEACLRLGGRFVWMPTRDSAFDTGEHGKGISILRGDELIEEARQVIDLAVEYSAALATCHLSFPESCALLKAAREAGSQRLIVTHPFYRPPALTLEEIEQLVELGAYAEFGFCTVSRVRPYATTEQVAQAIHRLGAERCILVTDGGQPHNPVPTEGFRVFLQRLWDIGISAEELDLMTITNPTALVEN